MQQRRPLSFRCRKNKTFELPVKHVASSAFHAVKGSITAWK
jgi:hypothetical protein